MKLKYIIALTTLFLTINLSAQKIEIKKTHRGHYGFYQNGNKLTINELVNIMKNNKESYKLMKSARLENYFISSAGLTGSVITGISLGKLLTGKKPNWASIGIGSGLMLSGIIFSKKNIDKRLKAVDIYNNSLSVSSSNFKPKFQIKLNTNAFGLVMSF